MFSALLIAVLAVSDEAPAAESAPPTEEVKPVEATPAADAPLAQPVVEPPAPKPVMPQPRGVWVGEHWRYQQKAHFLPWLRDFVLRTLADFISIPTSIVRWEFQDYVAFTLGVGIPVGMSIPINGQSIDSRLQASIRAGMGGPNCEYAEETHNSRLCDNPPTHRPRLWTLASDTAIMTTVLATPVLMMLIAALPDGGEPFVEASALAVEAFAVTQVYHLGLKFLTGREGPLAQDGYGLYYGPTKNSFPDGTPSGHSATLFSIAGVYATYFKTPWIQALILGSAAVLATFLIIDDAHYTSEVIVGSAMGYLIGRWVVEHRSSRYSYGANGLPVRLAGVAPISVRGDGAAFAAAFRF